MKRRISLIEKNILKLNRIYSKFLYHSKYFYLYKNINMED